jgi:hypothetical protein
MGGSPSNPINDQKKQQITNITTKVVGIFAEEYLLSYKDIMIKEAKKKKKKRGKKVW